MNRPFSIEAPLARDPYEITRDDGPPMILVLFLIMAVFAFVFLSDPSFVTFEQSAINSSG
jgi:hypothetical protein